MAACNNSFRSPTGSRVVVILGVLAAIAIPQVAETMKKACSRAMPADRETSGSAAEACFGDNTTDVGDAAPTGSSAVTPSMTAQTATGWATPQPLLLAAGCGARTPQVDATTFAGCTMFRTLPRGNGKRITTGKQNPLEINELSGGHGAARSLPYREASQGRSGLRRSPHLGDTP
jgi:hypothetical protein